MAYTPLRVAFIGAGEVNFGGGEGPWDHATRLEQFSKHAPLRVVGIADPFTQRAEQALDERRSNPEHEQLWQDTRVFANIIEMLDTIKPDAVFIGVPPLFHGSNVTPRDIELQCARRNIHMFIEKPISCASCREVCEVAKALEERTKRGLIISVGYMFRYSKAVLKMKEIIQKYGSPRAFNARYNCAYSTISKTAWWNVNECGGPIVEQATHFCDLARFLVGEVDFDSVQATALKQTDSLGQLNKLPSVICEDVLHPEQRVPRVTSALWRFRNGAVGSLIHGILLHGTKYETEVEIWGDGYRLVLVDPYSKCLLTIRLPDSDDTQYFDFSNDDYYFCEDFVFLQSIITGDTTLIQSPYSDSVNTYRMTVAIREASLIDRPQSITQISEENLSRA